MAASSSAEREITAIDTIFVVLVSSRWIHFSSLYVVFGSSFFWIHMGRAASHAAPSLLPKTMARCAAINRIAAPLVALSGLVWLMASIANMTGDFAGVIDAETLHAFFFETSFGPLAAGRIALFVGLVVIVALRIDQRKRLSLSLVASGLILISQAWLGHAAEDSGTFYGASMIAAYVVHVLAGAAWLGGLVPLVLAVVELCEHGVSAGSAIILRILSRYSAMAVLAAAAVVISGVANSAFRIGVPSSEILSSPYGTILLVKVGLVFAMLAFAGITRFGLMPRLGREHHEHVRIGLIASICAEATIGMVVLAAAALLGITPPPN